ncbi:MAG: alpha/beta hydrolase [Candidatus Wallbacteria bacterium]|nr:alpha/beta hydrolase [Candidatus Wallbacteria bacterium]
MTRILFLFIFLTSIFKVSASDDSSIMASVFDQLQQKDDKELKSAYCGYIRLEEKAEALHAYAQSLADSGNVTEEQVKNVTAAYKALAVRRTDLTRKILDSRGKPKDSIRMHEDVISLNNEIFDKTYVNLGYDDPAEFMKRVDSGVYLLDPYQQGKAVVLFVHGHGASPSDFDFINKNLDKNRFQAWAFYYPSGEAVKDTSARLLNEIKALKAKYNFTDLYIVGHSLGGVITRDLFAQNKDTPVPGLKGIMTLASPNKGVSFKIPWMFELVCLVILDHVDKSLSELYVNSPLLNEINGHPVQGVKFVTYAGNKPKNWFYSFTSKIMGGVNDGLVKVENAAIDGAANTVLPEDHSTIRLSQNVVQALNKI